MLEEETDEEKSDQYEKEGNKNKTIGEDEEAKDKEAYSLGNGIFLEL